VHPVRTPVTLSYPDVVETLLKILIMIYNKLVDISKATNEHAYPLYKKFVQEIDPFFLKYIVNQILNDLKAVALQKSNKSMLNIMDALLNKGVKN
jgi:hypothetical protein